MAMTNNSLISLIVPIYKVEKANLNYIQEAMVGANAIDITIS